MHNTLHIKYKYNKGNYLEKLHVTGRHSFYFILCIKTLRDIKSIGNT